MLIINQKWKGRINIQNAMHGNRAGKVFCIFLFMAAVSVAEEHPVIRLWPIEQVGGECLVARLSRNYTTPAYAAFDDADRESCEPDFVILTWAAYLLEGETGPGLEGVDWYPVCGEWLKELGIITGDKQ